MTHHTDKTEAMRMLEAEVRTCQKCGLCQGRTHAVPGEGDLNSVIMFVGEGPGADEDAQGRPFVGRSGQLLTRMLDQVRIERSHVYITNVVKCRPPGNRDPLAPEIRACQDYLDRQIAIINPRVIVTLGRISMQRWFPGTGITRVHGRARNIGRGRCAIPLFHPAAVLRDPGRMNVYEQVFARLPALIERAQAANQRAAQGEGRAAGEPHPGDPDFPAAGQECAVGDAESGPTVPTDESASGPGTDYVQDSLFPEQGH